MSAIIRHPMHSEFLKAILCFAGAGASWFGICLADASPPEVPSWLVQGGSGLSMVGLLIYAVVHLNRENRRLQDLREQDRLRMEAQWKEEHQLNRDSQNKLRTAITGFANVVRRRLPKEDWASLEDNPSQD
jgi:hypothetical protein